MLKLSKEHIDHAIKADNLYSLRALEVPSAGILLARWLMALGLLFIIFLFLPWQQNVRGIGKVTALSPKHRPQTVESVIAGQIQTWHVKEGDFVRRGDAIVTIREVKEKYFDPQLLTRLREQVTAKKNSLTSKEDKVTALRQQVTALQDGMRQKIAQAKAKVEAERVKFANAENQFQRNKRLSEAGNIPLTKFQEVESKYQASAADYQNATVEIDRLKAEFQEKISKAQSDLSATQAEIFETQGEISKLSNEYQNTLIRSGQYHIVAPQDGYIVRAMRAGIGETLKEGDAVCTVMPEARDLAVEMFVKAMDVPLISKGRKVRIEFDGWPALQFSGWPSVSVGSFGGTVEVIDYASSKPGEFRILIVPDATDEPWPTQLRVGSGTRGWVMLNNVPMWYEMWRQLNGFPPSLYNGQLEVATPDNKQPKPESEKK